RQHLLVGADRLFLVRRRLLARKRRHATCLAQTVTSAIAALAAPSCAGATESSRKPASTSAGIAAGSPAASPQRLTGIPRSAPNRATPLIRRSTAGWRTEASDASAPLSRAAAITYCVRSFEPIEKNA